MKLNTIMSVDLDDVEQFIESDKFIQFSIKQHNRFWYCGFHIIECEVCS